MRQIYEKKFSQSKFRKLTKKRNIKLKIIDY